MLELQPGSVHVAQVIRKTTDTSIGVWFLDTEVSMSAYGHNVSLYPIGMLVVCRVDKECRHVDKVRPAPGSVKRAYKGRSLVPQPEPGDVLVGQVTEILTGSCVSVWLLDDTGSMVAVGVRANDFPPGTIVYCRVDSQGNFLDKLRPVSRRMMWRYRHKRIM